MAKDDREMDTFLGSSRSYGIEKDRRGTCHTMGWKRMVLVLVIGIVTGIFIIILSLLINLLTPTTPDETNAEVAQKWYKTEAYYEIVTESFQDSSPKAQDVLKKGYGVGDIKGKYGGMTMSRAQNILLITHQLDIITMIYRQSLFSGKLTYYI